MSRYGKGENFTLAALLYCSLRSFFLLMKSFGEKMNYRYYKPSDASAVETLFLAVFTKYGGGAEGSKVGKLSKDLIADTDFQDIFGFVAENRNTIVGAIFFSRLCFEEDIDVFILSPVAVDNDRQGKGVGQGLITFGLLELKKRDIKIVTTYGDPAYYSKVGFQPISENIIKAPLHLSRPEGWLAQSLTGELIESIPGACTCVKALNNSEYW